MRAYATTPGPVRAPLLWMLQARGYDLESLRKTQTETERQLTLARQEIDALRRVIGAGR